MNLNLCREDRVRLVAEVKSTKAALLDAKTKSVTEDTDMNRDASAVDQESGDWLEVEKRVSSAGHVDIAAVSTTEVELKRRVDKLSSMITEVCILASSGNYCYMLRHCETLLLSTSIISTSL